MRRRGAGVGLALIAVLAAAGPADAGTQEPTKSLGKARGLEYRTATFPQVASLAGASVACKADTFAIGGGGIIDGADGLSVLASSAPDDANPDDTANKWRALATGNGARDERTYAICAKEALQFVAEPTALPGSPGIETRVGGCPTGRLVSGGIFNDNDSVRILESRPVDGPADLDTVPDDGWQMVAQNNGGSTANPIIFMICSETADLTYVTKAKNTPAGALGKPVAKCPNRYAVSGGGFEAAGGGTPSGLVPWDSKDKGTTPEDGWQARVYNASIDTLAIKSTAICLRKL